MASDLAATPTTGLAAQCCGDAHVANFGVFASPERRLVFDVNDFDETLPGPWEWDLKRLAASIVIAARQNGLDRHDQDAAALGTVEEYRTAMARFADDEEPRRLVRAPRRQLGARAARAGRRRQGRAADDEDARQGAHVR